MASCRCRVGTRTESSVAAPTEINCCPALLAVGLNAGGALVAKIGGFTYPLTKLAVKPS